jgi:hypothetical protein
MWSWELGQDGQLESGAHDYGAQDILGQAALTGAMFDWLLDDQAVHPLNLNRSLREFNLILGIYTSALHHEVVTLPVAPEPNLIAALRQGLSRDVA